jgi:hypothetical protein
VSRSRNSPTKSCYPRPRRVYPIDDNVFSSKSRPSPRPLPQYPTTPSRNNQLKPRTPVLLGRRRNGVGVRTRTILLILEARNANADVARWRLRARGSRVDTIGGLRGRGTGMGTVSRRGCGESAIFRSHHRSLEYHGQASRGMCTHSRVSTIPTRVVARYPQRACFIPKVFHVAYRIRSTGRDGRTFRSFTVKK